jgi:hypothetical protein
MAAKNMDLAATIALKNLKNAIDAARYYQKCSEFYVISVSVL